MSCVAVQTVRKELYDHLCRINPDKNWDFIINQVSTVGSATASELCVWLSSLMRHAALWPEQQHLSPSETTCQRDKTARICSILAIKMCGADFACLY